MTFHFTLVAALLVALSSSLHADDRQRRPGAADSEPRAIQIQQYPDADALRVQGKALSDGAEQPLPGDQLSPQPLTPFPGNKQHWRSQLPELDATPIQQAQPASPGNSQQAITPRPPRVPEKATTGTPLRSLPAPSGPRRTQPAIKPAPSLVGLQSPAAGAEKPQPLKSSKKNVLQQVETTGGENPSEQARADLPAQQARVAGDKSGEKAGIPATAVESTAIARSEVVAAGATKSTFGPHARGFVVQLGAFKNVEKLETFIARHQLTTEGLDRYVTLVDGKVWHVLTWGYFADRQEARQQWQQNGKPGIDTWIRSTESLTAVLRAR